MRKQIGVRVLVVCLAVAMIVGGVVGSTIAWLFDQTSTITNTFVVGGEINIELTESTGETYKIDSTTTDLAKDPKVTVKAGSIKCFIFVEITELNNLDAYISYNVAEPWVALPDNPNVYYIEIDDTTTEDTDYPILKDNKVTVNSQNLYDQDIAMEDANRPKLVFTAYAIQNSSNFADATAAWDALNNELNNSAN